MNKYHLVRLTNIDGERHDFIFIDKNCARIRFGEYVKYAGLDEEIYCAEVFVIENKLIEVNLTLKYHLREVKKLSWKVELVEDLGFEQ